MGQSCGCADGNSQDDRIKELQSLLDTERAQYEKLQDNFDEIVSDTKRLVKTSKKSTSKFQDKLRGLESDKQSAFKEMMKEKSKMKELSKAKEDLERKKRNMEKQINKYKQDLSKFEESSVSKGDEDYSDLDMRSVDIKSVSATPTPQGEVDVNSDVKDIDRWMNIASGDKKQDHKAFTKCMTDMLVRRSKAHQLEIAATWQSAHHGRSLFDAIENKLSGKTRGVPYRVLSSLMQSTAEVDVRYMQECIYNDMQINKVASVIVSRSPQELREIQLVWQKQYKTPIQGMLDKLAKSNNKNTMAHLFGNLCNTEQRLRNNQMQRVENVNSIEIARHVEWMIGASKYKHPEKERLCRLLTINSDAYVQMICKQYKSKSKTGETVPSYIDKKYGPKSMVGMHLKDHLAFVMDKDTYFADKLFHLAETKQKFRDNHLEIVNLFLARADHDLFQISAKFQERHDHKLRHFLKNVGQNHSSLYFLMKILENSSLRYL